VYLQKAIALVERQIEFIQQQILAEQTGVDCPLKQKTQRLKWTVQKVDYVEWVYALHEILNLNGGKVTLDTLFDFFNPIFDMNPINFNQVFTAIKNRKKGDRTTLLNMQKTLLTRRMEKPIINDFVNGYSIDENGNKTYNTRLINDDHLIYLKSYDDFSNNEKRIFEKMGGKHNGTAGNY